MSDDKNNDIRFKYVEEKLDKHEQRIENVESLSSEFAKISTILEMQTEMNKRQDETLNNINNNLTALNQTTKQLSERVSGLEEDVKQSNDKDSISLSETMKKVVWAGTSVAIGIIIAFIFSKFGM